VTGPSEKQSARAAAAARRAEAFAADPAAGLALAAQWPNRATPRSGAIISAYWPFRTEIDPRPLMQRLAEAGARLALPVTPPRGADEPVRFHLWSTGEILHVSAFGVHEPHPGNEVVEPDLVLLPLLAGASAMAPDTTTARLNACAPSSRSAPSASPSLRRRWSAFPPAPTISRWTPS